MNYPLVPHHWQEPITQNIYASIIVLLIQAIMSYVFHKIAQKKSNKKFIWIRLYIISFSVPFILLLIIALLSNNISYVHILIISLGGIIYSYGFYKQYEKVKKKMREFKKFINRINSTCIDNAIVNPNIDNYNELLSRANNGFSLLGIGAEKLTRDFELFKNNMNRCSSIDNPARFLLVAPDEKWVNDGSSRRGLGKNYFKELLVKSLKNIAQLKKEYNVPVEVRFYKGKPLFRILLINNNECWFGYYSESVVKTGENEFKNKSQPTLIIKRPSDKPPDREFYGTLEAFYNELWDNAKEKEWDFKKFIE